MKNSLKKSENKALLAELKESKKDTNSISEIAQKTQIATQEIKIRDVNYKNQHVEAKANLKKDKRESVKRELNHYTRTVSDTEVIVFETTKANFENKANDAIKKFFNIEHDIVLSTQVMQAIYKIYVEKLASLQRFTIRDLRNFASIDGINQTDTPRTEVMKHSYLTTQDELSEHFDANIQAAIAAKKELLAAKIDNKFVFIKV